jgi:hypothetical protein
MSRLPIIRPFVCLVATCILSLASVASAGPTIPYKARAKGVAIMTAPGKIEFQAEGRATHLGRYTDAGRHDFAFTSPTQGVITNGSFTTTAANGATISGTHSGTFEVISPTLIRFNVTVQWQKGTGRLRGVTGTAEVVAVWDITTGEFHYDKTGTWTRP